MSRAAKTANLDDEIAASDLKAHPARLVLLQNGADDIHFGACLEYELARVLGAGFGIGTNCVANGAVTPEIAADLSRVRSGLASAIEEIAPDAGTVAVLDYYQPIPAPSADRRRFRGLGPGDESGLRGPQGQRGHRPPRPRRWCSPHSTTPSPAPWPTRVAHGVHNVVLVDVARALDGHGMCTADPWVFSAEPISDATLASDAEHILAAKACYGGRLGAPRRLGVQLAGGAVADQAEQTLKDYVWRAAHPTAPGQRALAADVEQALRGRA